MGITFLGFSKSNGSGEVCIASDDNLETCQSPGYVPIADLIAAGIDYTDYNVFYLQFLNAGNFAICEPILDTKSGNITLNSL